MSKILEKICWICGGIATTKEHIIKKTDVEALFGSRSYQNKKIFKTDFDRNKNFAIQGASSNQLKHDVNFCAKCNSETTQPYDKAYKEFSTYIRNNFKEIKKNRFMNMNLIFGKRKSKEMQKNLFCYFIKCFGCQLDKLGLSIPNEIKYTISSGFDFKNTLKIRIFIDKRENHLGNIPFDGIYRNGNHSDYLWAQYNGWFTTIYIYNQLELRPDEWCGKSKRIFLTNKVPDWQDLI